tara:strand:+ start:1405 stop:1785 length:381 start_codon:yes stop_codon:yes gene_type:complete
MENQEILYTKDHEWLKHNHDSIYIVGITTYAATQLGDIVYIDLPDQNTSVNQFEKLGEIESVKAVSDIYSPISGKIIDVNVKLNDHPELINDSAFDQGWLVKILIDNQSELSNLMNQTAYNSLITE